MTRDIGRGQRADGPRRLERPASGRLPGGVPAERPAERKSGDKVIVVKGREVSGQSDATKHQVMARLEKLADSIYTSDSHATVRTTAGGLYVVERKRSVSEQGDRRGMDPSPHQVKHSVLADIRPSEEWMQAYQAVLERALPRFANKYELSVETAKAQLDAKVAELIQGTRIWTRVKPETIASILHDDRFKSQIETGTSGGWLNPSWRKRTEYHLFGYEWEDARPRPIYGYLADAASGYGEQTWHYGSAVILLKERLRAQTTFTLGDCLVLSNRGKYKGYILALPVPLEKPTLQAMNLVALLEPTLSRGMMSRPNPLTWKSLRDTGIYTETQIHGGVRSSEIEAVIFRNPAEVLSYPETLKMLIERDIPFFFDFSPRLDLEMSLPGRLKPVYEEVGKTLGAKYGHEIKIGTTMNWTRLHRPFLNELGLKPINWWRGRDEHGMKKVD